MARQKLGRMNNKNYIIQFGQEDRPLFFTAVHHGHHIREELIPYLNLDDATRLREEDPFTGEWAALCGNRAIVNTSRFEVDLNRAREEAVYLEPKDAWGLEVWNRPLPEEIIKTTMRMYDEFYNDMRTAFLAMQKKYGKFIVFDLHSYNFKRQGPDGPVDNPKENPDVNIGTGTMTNRKHWAGVVDRFISDLSKVSLNGSPLDVRENVKFRGRQLGRWAHETFPESACVLSIDIKKIFMDEWSGAMDQRRFDIIKGGIAATIPGVLQALSDCGNS